MVVSGVTGRKVGVLEGEDVERVTAVVQVLLVEGELGVVLPAYRPYPPSQPWLHRAVARTADEAVLQS